MGNPPLSLMERVCSLANKYGKPPSQIILIYQFQVGKHYSIEQITLMTDEDKTAMMDKEFKIIERYLFRKYNPVRFNERSKQWEVDILYSFKQRKVDETKYNW